MRRLSWIGGFAVLVTASAALAATLPSLAGYAFVGSMTVTDKSSPIAGLHHFYANATAKRALAGNARFPKGAEFRGRLYEIEQTEFGIVAGAVKATTVMKKDPAATDTGGWLFSVVLPDGTKPNVDVKTACFACHEKAKFNDFVFSRRLD